MTGANEDILKMYFLTWTFSSYVARCFLSAIWYQQIDTQAAQGYCEWQIRNSNKRLTVTRFISRSHGLISKSHGFPT